MPSAKGGGMEIIMKKLMITLVAMLLMICSAVPCFAESSAEILPEIRMEQQKKEYRTPQGQVCIVTDYTRLIVENADRFPALAKKLEQVHNTEWKYRMEDDARTGFNDAVELKKHRPEDYMHFLLEERIWQKYLDRNILSLYVEFYQNRGGTRPDIEISSYNLDPVTGEFITLDDVLAPGKRNEFRENYVKPALEIIKNDRQLFYYDNYKSIVDELFRLDYAGEPPLTWTWGNEGITMYWAPGILGPAVIGPVEAFVPLKGNETLFNKRFLK